MNAFDLVATVALGSTLATTLLSKDVPLAEGVAGSALLIALQYLIAWSSVRHRWVSRMVKSDPALLCYDGEYLRGAMRRERVTEEEVRAAARSQGMTSPDEALAVVLETDGSFTVLRRPEGHPPGSEGRKRLQAVLSAQGGAGGAGSREPTGTS